MKILLGFRTLLGLRSWLFLLVASSTLPLSGALVWSAWETREVMAQDATRAMNERLARASMSFQAEVSQVLDVMALLARDNNLSTISPDGCDERLASLSSSASLSGLVIVDRAGDMVCGFPSAPEPVNLSDRDYFQAAREEARTVMGKPATGRITGRAILPFAAWLPSDETAGPACYGIAARLDLEEVLAKLSAQFGMPAVRLTLWTADGGFVARSAAPSSAAEQPLPPQSFIQGLIADSG